MSYTPRYQTNTGGNDMQADFDSMTEAEREAHSAAAKIIQDQMVQDVQVIEDGPDDVYADEAAAEAAIVAAQALRRQPKSGLRALLADPKFRQTVKGAHQHLVIQRVTRIEEARQPLVIVLYTPYSGDPFYRMHSADQWEIPVGHVNGSVLGGAHTIPQGERLARVELDGSVTLL
jgi:hypothetical protein